MKKKTLCVIISVCLLLAMLSTTVFAEAAKALIAVGGTNISFFNIDDTTVITATGSTSSEFLNSAVFVDDTLYYANSTGQFGTIDCDTGAITIISSGNQYHLISYNVLDGKFYGLSVGNNSSLYTIDPATGNATFVSSIASGFILDFTITNDGRFIAIDGTSDTLIEIDPLTGDCTETVPAGFDINYGQGLSTDRSTNTVYWAACNNSSGKGQLYKVELPANTLTFISDFTTQVSCFAIMSDFEKHPPKEINEVDADGNPTSFETIINAYDSDNVASIEWKIFEGATDVTSLWNITRTNTGLGNIKVISSATITDNGYNTVNGNARTFPSDFTVVAVIIDGMGNETQRTWTVKINDIDRSPAQPTVTVKKNGEVFSETTGHIYAGDELTASCAIANDSDGDTITYEYRWTNSGTGRPSFTENKAANESSSVSDVAAGEIWSLDVRAVAKPGYVAEDDSAKYRSEWKVTLTNISTHIFDVETASDATKKTDATCTKKAVYYKSCSCGAISTTDTFEYGTVITHNANNDKWLYDETGHWHTCADCSGVCAFESHIPGAAATENSPQVCTVCGYVITPAITVIPSPVIPKTGNDNSSTLMWIAALVVFQSITTLFIYGKRRKSAVKK